MNVGEAHTLELLSEIGKRDDVHLEALKNPLEKRRSVGQMGEPAERDMRARKADASELCSYALEVRELMQSARAVETL